METSQMLIGTCVLSQQVFANAIGEAVEVLPTVFHVTENYIIIAMSSGEIHVFNLHGTRKEVLSSSPGAVWALVVRGDMLVSGGTNNSIEIWDLATGSVASILEPERTYINIPASPSKPAKNKHLTFSVGFIASPSKRYRDTRPPSALLRSLATRRGLFQRRAILRFVSGTL